MPTPLLPKALINVGELLLAIPDILSLEILAQIASATLLIISSAQELLSLMLLLKLVLTNAGEWILVIPDIL